MGKSGCKRCVYLVDAVGREKSILVCTNRYGQNGGLVLFEADSPCRNYQQKRIVDRPIVSQPQNSDIRFIPLTRGKFAIVDADDYAWLGRFKWHCVVNKKRAYAYHSFEKKNTSMHRIIMKPPGGMVVDHIDGNGLNNTRKNLRICTPRQNTCNSKGQGKTSGYKGVCRIKNSKKWLAQITYTRKNKKIGCFETEITAAQAYDRKAKELFGEFAYLNFPNL